MSDADQAYMAAQAEIAQVKAAGGTLLDLNDYAYRALTILPPEIATLEGLQALDLDQTKVADITPLQNLTALQSLILHQTQVADISPLQNLTAMQTLSLSRTQVADITPLQNLTALQTLSLSRTQVADITPLQNLTALETLFLHQTKVADITPLQNLTALKDLYLNSCPIADMRPVIGLTDLGTKRPFDGLTFTDTAATKADPELRRLSEIEDKKDRATQTRAYLKTLPPFPEPLPWQNAASAQTQKNTPSGLKRLTLSQARQILETDHPAVKDRCQRIVAELDDALSLQTLRKPNEPDLLKDHEQITRTLELAKGFAVGLHEALPEELNDRRLTETEASRLKKAFDKIIDELQRAAAYVDRTDHSPTYGGVLRMGCAGLIGSLVSIAPGVALTASVPAVYAILYGKAAAVDVLGKIRPSDGSPP